jgi:LysM repeat protein
MFRKWIVLITMVFVVAIASAQAQEITYVVKRGDTLTSIATQYNVSVEAILVRNGIISANYISVGQTLIIPTAGVTAPTTYVVQPNDNLTSIAQRFNTTVEALRATNNLVVGANITAGQVLRLPATGGAFTLLPYPQNYTINTGETLRSIATKFGTTWQTLATYNNIATPNYVQAGAVIVIPPTGYVPPVVTPQPVVTPIVTPVAPATGGPVVVINTPIVGRSYVVQVGDTLFAIATRANRNVYAIAQANGILNLNAIYVGQRLVIP